METKPIRVSSIIMSLIEIVVGILLLIDPEGFTVGIITCLGIVLMVAGLVSIVQYFRQPTAAAVLERGLTKGIIGVVAGLFCIIKRHWFIGLFPVIAIIYGIVTLVLGITKIQWTADMIRAKIKKWGWVAVDAVVTILCAVIILCNPFTTAAVLWIFVAVSLIVEAVIDIFVAIFAKDPTNGPTA